MPAVAFVTCRLVFLSLSFDSRATSMMATERRLVTYLDTDPVIQYSPSLDDTADTLGWMTYFPVVQKAPVGPLDFVYGVGDSRRITGSAGASLQFQFYGSSVSLYGSASSIRYNVQVDDQPAQEPAESGGVLASITGLEPAIHTIKLTVLETHGFTLSFDRVEFDIGMRSDWKNSTYPARIGFPGWTYTDDAQAPWTNLTSYWHDGSDRTQDCVVTTALGAKASLQFTGSAVYIIGNTLADHGRFKIRLSSPDRPETTAIYQGRTNFTTIEALMYFQGGLDPSKTHTLTIENFENSFVDVVRAIVATGKEQHPSSGSEPNIGSIAGGVVGGVTFLLALVALIIVIFRHRRTSPDNETEDAYRTNWDVPSDTGSISPFIPPLAMQQAHHPTITPYVFGSGFGNLDLEQSIRQAYFVTSSLRPSTPNAVPPNGELSTKQEMMMIQHQRVRSECLAEEAILQRYPGRSR